METYFCAQSMIGKDTASRPDLGSMQNRQLTVMFVDMVGSTELAHTLEPEDFASVSLEYQDTVTVSAIEFGGHLARIVGDGMLVLFGWPIASENAAEQALRAALHIHDELGKLQLAVDVRCRIGVATGPALVGEVSQTIPSQPLAVFGTTPNLASRLHSLAAPSETIVSATTQRIALRSMKFYPLGSHELLGFSDPEYVYRLIGLERLEKRREGRAEFVGRNAEMSRLSEVWRDAQNGKGSIALLSGEAGMGKSRLLSEFRDIISPDRILTLCCNPFHTTTPFQPFVKLVEDWCEVGEQDTVDERREKVTTRFHHIVKGPLLRTLCETVAPDEGPLSTTSEGQLLTRLTKVFSATLKYISETHSTLLIVEDLQWADASTMLLLKGTAPILNDLPMVSIMTQRPGEDEAASLFDAIKIDLRPLSNVEAMKLASRVSGAKLGSETLSRLIERSNGVPLFIEECAAHLAQSREAKETDIPATLQDILLQKLDESGASRFAAVNAAVLGREFRIPTLAMVSEIEESEAEAAVNDLNDLRILEPSTRRAGGGDGYWRFRHALHGDVAYQCLNRDARMALHRRVAIALTDGGGALREPEVVARHWEFGGEVEKSVDLWTLAARFHLRRHANVEGSQHARNGLALIDKMPPDRQDLAELELQFLLAAGERMRAGYGSEQTVIAFRRCFNLAERLGDKKMFVRAGRGLFTAAMVHAHYAQAEELGKRLIDGLDSRHGRMVGHYFRGSALSPQGRFLEAADALHEARKEASLHSREQGDRADDAAVIQVESMAALVASFKGEAVVALERSKQALEAAKAMKQPLTIANAQHWATEIHMQLEHPEYAKEAEAFVVIAKATASPYYMAVAHAHAANIEIRLGNPAKGVAMLQESWAGMNNTGAVASGVLVNTELAKGLLATGDVEGGFAAIRAARRCAETFSERSYEPELLITEAALLEADHAPKSQISAALRSSISIARGQGAQLYELRALRLLQPPDEGELRRLTWLEDHLLPELNAIEADGKGRLRL